MIKFSLAILSMIFTFNVSAAQIKFVSTDDTVGTKIGIAGSSFNNRSVAMGSYNLKEEGASATVVGFCVDPFQAADSNYRSYVKSSLDASDFTNSGNVRLQNVQKIFDNAYSTLSNDKAKTAGFHLALWEIFHDDLNLSSGIITGVTGTNPDVLNYANGFLGNLSNWQVSNRFQFDFYESGTYQNYLVPSEVPLPAALPMFLSGLAGLGIIRRRKSNLL